MTVDRDAYWIQQSLYALARACHEMVNRHFKCFGCLSNTYRHPLHWHGTMFHAIANITQLTIMDNEPLLQQARFSPYNCVIGSS